jgi:RNA polymerase sigma-70 factor, ECF subfamily
MTVWSNSVPFPSSERALRPAGKGLQVQTPSFTADGEARRLATAVGRGDEGAFRELYDRYQDRLFRFAMVLGHGDETLAAETVQSVFVTAAASLRRIESEGHLWHWLARVARQQLSRTWRQRLQNPPVVSVAEVPDCADACEVDRLLEEKLDAALLAMEWGERQLIEWFYFDGLSLKEIGGQLGATPKAVSSRLERARARLRSLITRHLCHEI